MDKDHTTWEEIVAKELKEKVNLNSNWKMKDLDFSTFNLNKITHNPPIVSSTTSWNIGQMFSYSEFIKHPEYQKFSNIIWLDVEGLKINLSKFNTKNKFYLYGEQINKAPLEFLKNIKQDNVSIVFDPLNDTVLNWTETEELIDYAAYHNKKILGFNTNLETSVEGIPKVLSAVFSKINYLFKKYTGDKDKLATQIKICLPAQKSFFPNIAKFRAAQIIWYNILKAHNIPLFELEIVGYAHPSSFDKNENISTILMTSQAMSSIIGGCSELLLQTPDTVNKSVDKQRIATNIQHILALEANFQGLEDPSFGSDYIENMTNQILEAVKL